MELHKIGPLYVENIRTIKIFSINTSKNIMSDDQLENSSDCVSQKKYWKCPRYGLKALISGHFNDFIYKEICYISKSIWNILDLKKVPKSIFFK